MEIRFETDTRVLCARISTSYVNFHHISGLLGENMQSKIFTRVSFSSDYSIESRIYFLICLDCFINQMSAFQST